MAEQRECLRPNFGTAAGPQESLRFSRSSLPRSQPLPFVGSCYPTGASFISSVQMGIFIVFLSDREVPFREAVRFEGAANAALAEAAALTFPERRLPLAAFPAKGLVP